MKTKMAKSSGAQLNRPPGWLVLLFTAPAFLLFAIFLLGPSISVFVISAFEWRGTTQVGFAGLNNFFQLFDRVPFKHEIPRALGHNLVFFVGVFLLQNSIGLFLAIQLQRFKRARRVLQVIYTTPYLISPLVVGYLWLLLLSPTFGPVNSLLRGIGLDQFALAWLGDPSIALFTVIMIASWQWMGFPVLLYSAALAGMAPELDEAARVDGAGGMKRFWFITLPLMTPVVGTVSILTFISAMEVFPLVYALAGPTGSPAGATDVLGLLFYRTSFQTGLPNALGLSSALGVLMMFLVLGGAFVAKKIFRRIEEGLE